MDDNINSIKQFLNEFREVNSEENVKYRSNIISSYHMNPEDVKAEVLDWSQHYLEQKKCPYSLALMLSKLVAHQLSDSIYEMSLQAEEGIDDEDDKRFRYESSQLYSEMIECLSEAIRNWQDHVDLSALKVEPPPYIVSSSAIKNTRRKMEDRHVIIHDLNAVCGLKDMPRHSYYAIFDGHAGIEAASYCAAHLHWNIISHPEFLTNTEKAISEAVILTDKNLLERLYREGIKGGCTALCCLIRDRTMYIAWVGDSQAVLVKQGTPVPLGLPHKPDREDERCRVEELGGCILFLGTWRVNGTLAVSRALGDAEHKPYISNEPEVLKIPLDGTEDYVVLACDGLWDQLQPSDLGQVVYNHIIKNAESVDEVASKLVQLSKSQGSTDNITTIVVFLKDPLNIDKPDAAFPQLENEKDLQFDETTSLPEAFLNSGERKKQAVNTDVAINGVSNTEQLKNELNSLNFTETTIEPVVLSHLQEGTITSETLEHYEDSCISPALLAYENPLVQNYCNRDVALNNTQSTPTSLSNSVNSSISQVSDLVDLNQHVVMDTEQQQCVNQTIIENISPALVTISNSTNIYTNNTANLNQLITVSNEQGIGTGEPTTYNLSEIAEHTTTIELGRKETPISNNDFVVLEEKSESSNEAIMQSIEDLEINPNILPEVNKSNIVQLTEGMKEVVYKNDSEILNLQMFESSNRTETTNITSENFTVQHTDNLCEKVSNVAISNNFQTETIKVSGIDVFHSTDVENSYKQEEIPTLTLDEKLDFHDERDQVINNNNLDLAVAEDSNIDFSKIEPPSYIDEPDVDKNFTAQEFLPNHNPVTVENLSSCNEIDGKIVVDSFQAENECSGSALEKSNCLLHSKSEIDSGKLEPKEKCTVILASELSQNEVVEPPANTFLPKTKDSEVACPDISFTEKKQLEENDTLCNKLYEEDVLLHSANSLGIDKNESVNEQLSQNYNKDATDNLATYSVVDNTLINNNPQSEVSNSDESKTNASIDKTVSERSEVTATSTSENVGSIADNELNLCDKNDDINIDSISQPKTYTSSSSLNKDDSSLHTVDISDFNKYDLTSESSPQDCSNVIADDANLIDIPQSDDHFSTLGSKNTTEACLSPTLEESSMLHNGHKISDVPLTGQDITESKTLVSGNENKETIPSSLQITPDISPNEIKVIDGIQQKDDITRQPKCDKIEKKQTFESPVASDNNTKTIHSMKSNAKRSLHHHTKESVKTESSKIASNKKGNITKEPAIQSSNVGNRRQITVPKPAKSSLVKPMQAQPKVKQTVMTKDKTECQPGVKSTTVTKPKPAQPNVFERLSSPKVAFTKVKESRNGETLHLSKGSNGTSTTKTVPSRSDIRARNNLSSSDKTQGAVSKKLNTQAENIKSKTQTCSSISNNKLSTKMPRAPLSNQVTTNKAPRGNLPHKTDKLLQQSESSNPTEKPSNTVDANAIKKATNSTSRKDVTKQRSLAGTKMAERVLVNTTSKQDVTKQRSVGTKTTERVLVNTSSRQPTPLRPTSSTKLDIRSVNATNLQLRNSKVASVRSSKVAMERSSISSTKTREGKTTVVKSASGQKTESNTIVKMEESQIQNPNIATLNKNVMPNMDGQGDCITADNHLPEANESNIELPKLDTCNSMEVPNPTLHI